MRWGQGLAERVESKIRENPETGCWDWQGSKYKQGYAKTSCAGVTLRVHKILYKGMIGDIPEGRELDHLCRNRGCVNPSHLESVTHAENIRRGAISRGLTGESCQRSYRGANWVPSDTTGGWHKAECKRGHRMIGENVRTTSVGGRQCRACKRLAQRTYKASRRTR